MWSLIEYCSLSGNRATYYQYRLSLCLFLESVYDIHPAGRHRTAEEIAILDQKSKDYLTGESDHPRDLLKFRDVISEYSPMSQNSHFSTVLSWFDVNDIRLNSALVKKIKKPLPKRKPLTEDIAITRDDIKAWYEGLTRIGRVMLLVQLSSGMRIGELLAIRMEDVDLDSDPAIVQIRKHIQYNGTEWKPKNGDDRYTFLSQEAVSSIREWLKVRDEWLETACSRTFSTEKSRDDNRLFPLGKVSAFTMYTHGLKKAGLYELDENSGRSKIISHSLRKFFSSQLRVAGMQSEYVELIMGHLGYLSNAYVRYPVDQVADAYKAAEYAVSLSSTIDPKEMQDIRKQYGIAMSENQNLKLTMRDEMREMIQEYIEAKKLTDQIKRKTGIR